MSHLFISYAHHDKVHLDRLLAWLSSNDFTTQEIWYDQHIESGNNWRDDIAKALDEAFAMVVIVTSQSMKSLYCTYEWAYAMGQGIPILPLTFENIAISDVPTPLTTKQFTTCIETIPVYLKDQLRQLKSVPPQVAVINKAVYEAIYDTHRRFFILGWVGDRLSSLDYELKRNSIDYFATQASKAHKSLEALMVDKAFAFSGRQHRFCWQLVDFLRQFSSLEGRDEDYLPEHLFARFEGEWLPAFEYFEEKKGWWRQWTWKYFKRDLEHESNRMYVTAEMLRAFPIFIPQDVEMFIHNRRLKLKRKADSEDN